MNEESRVNLRQIAWDAAMMQTRATEKPAADIYSEWRLKLERIVMIELADVALACMGHHAPKLGR